MRYNVTDESGNSAIESVRLVKVVDSTGPDITIIGDTAVTVPYGVEFLDPGATAFDIVDGDVSENITVLTTVDTGNIGIYQIRYSVVDDAGNLGQDEVRIVTVKDLTPPTVELIGSNRVIILEGSDYVDLGAVAIDNLDGDISDTIIVESNMDTSSLGYIL